jgi:hypothetical protein
MFLPNIGNLSGRSRVPRFVRYLVWGVTGSLGDNGDGCIFEGLILAFTQALRFYSNIECLRKSESNQLYVAMNGSSVLHKCLRDGTFPLEALVFRRHGYDVLMGAP